MELPPKITGALYARDQKNNAEVKAVKLPLLLFSTTTMTRATLEDGCATNAIGRLGATTLSKYYEKL